MVRRGQIGWLGYILEVALTGLGHMYMKSGKKSGMTEDFDLNTWVSASTTNYDGKAKSWSKIEKENQQFCLYNFSHYMITRYSSGL